MSFILGITGGIGMGKSTSAALLRQRGIPVLDTDDVARDVVAPGTDGLAEVHAAFGPSVLDGEGRLDRRRLAEQVFSDPDARLRLESIVHPRIAVVWRRQVGQWRHDTSVTVGVVVIPLLFEKDYGPDFDAVVCVACSVSTQGHRLSQRGWTPDETARRKAAQWPVDRKIAASRYVIWTEGHAHSVAAQWDRVLTLCR